ncbi:hypothetical protein Pla110_30960 [Polystyrenella longa]|uniref:Uncharacterized protein n=1 Tax=Polystyrenella longa TaxID=2528007 RepID=A0A518CQ59_9PLAN|nr:hypothetical protein Pla110_30960 [Polystyrenella longa]
MVKDAPPPAKGINRNETPESSRFDYLQPNHDVKLFTPAPLKNTEPKAEIIAAFPLQEDVSFFAVLCQVESFEFLFVSDAKSDH